MKKYILLFVLVFVFAQGCTAPTQPIAQESFRLGIQQEHTIISDLSLISKQYAVDKAVADARAAAAKNDLDAVQMAVEKLASDFETVSWLQIQHERARAVMRVAQQYIWEQKGIFDVMKKEIEQASKITEHN